jgi:hypothetical protein
MAAESWTTRKKDVDVEELLKKLHLSNIERVGVVLAKEDRENLPAIKWMAAARLLTTKGFSEASLMFTMKSAWNPARDIFFHSIGKNLFVVQAFFLGDWKKNMEEGPWIFLGCALMIEEFDGATTIPTVLPHKVPAWVQIHKLPPLYRSEAILKLLAGRIGEEVMVDMHVVPTRDGDFSRFESTLKPIILW